MSTISADDAAFWTLLGFPERPDPAALVVGPTGLGFSQGTLYVADSDGNRIGLPPGRDDEDRRCDRTTVSSNGFLDDLSGWPSPSMETCSPRTALTENS